MCEEERLLAGEGHSHFVYRTVFGEGDNQGAECFKQAHDPSLFDLQCYRAFANDVFGGGLGEGGKAAQQGVRRQLFALRVWLLGRLVLCEHRQSSVSAAAVLAAVLACWRLSGIQGVF